MYGNRAASAALAVASGSSLAADDITSGPYATSQTLRRCLTAGIDHLHAAKAPIRSLYRVDRFGWSRRLRGGDDMKSMAAGNSSGFNCRSVVGRPGRRSPHSTGRSIDLNTWENPYRSAWGIVPNRDWDARRSPAAFVYRSRTHAVVRILARHGFRWLGSADWQHFQYAGRGARHLPASKTFWD